LLLTVEMVATAAFRVPVPARTLPRLRAAGLAALLFAAVLIGLAAAGGAEGGSSTLRGALLVLGAAVAWGLDNTVSARLVGGYEPRSSSP